MKPEGRIEPRKRGDWDRVLPVSANTRSEQAAGLDMQGWDWGAALHTRDRCEIWGVLRAEGPWTQAAINCWRLSLWGNKFPAPNKAR